MGMGEHSAALLTERHHRMAISPDIKEADKEARIALLKKIAEEVQGDPTVDTLYTLAQAYNLVTENDAPQEAARTRIG